MSGPASAGRSGHGMPSQDEGLPHANLPSTKAVPSEASHLQVRMGYRSSCRHPLASSTMTTWILISFSSSPRSAECMVCMATIQYYDDLDSDFVFEFPKVCCVHGVPRTTGLVAAAFANTSHTAAQTLQQLLPTRPLPALPRPQSWVGRQNRQRPGLYFANFQTADKCQVEVFSLDPDSSGSSSGGGSEARVPRVAAAAVAKLINPGGTVDPEVGGDARLELPSSSQIKTSTAEIDGQVSWVLRGQGQVVGGALRFMGRWEGGGC